MRFGQFLARRALVSALEVLSALEEQARRRTFLSVMLARAGFLSADFALESTATFGRNDEELLVDSFRRGVISARDYQNFDREWRASAPPLGEILVERGQLSQLQLNALLSEFHARNSLCVFGSPSTLMMESRT